MNIETLREFCLAQRGVSEGFPFDQITLVFKVMDKMFLLTNVEGELSINVKCDPEKAIALREQYPCVKPGYHMSKVHWNTVEIDGGVSDEQLKEWIMDSYYLVVDKLPKKVQKELDLL